MTRNFTFNCSNCHNAFGDHPGSRPACGDWSNSITAPHMFVKGSKGMCNASGKYHHGSNAEGMKAILFGEGSHDRFKRDKLNSFVYMLLFF